MSHRVDQDDLCRICTNIFTKAHDVQRFKCSDFKDEIEEYFILSILPTDPLYFCNACHTYLTCCLMRDKRVCSKFVKRLWQVECGDHCDTCNIHAAKMKGGRPGKHIFVTHRFKNKPRCMILPTEQQYSLQCGVCCSVIHGDSCLLPCGHIECVDCEFKIYKCTSRNNSTKCSKCLQVSETHSHRSISLIAQTIQCKCKTCGVVGPFNQMKDHKCGEQQPVMSLTVEQLLSGSVEGSNHAAQLISQKWLPKLAENGTFTATQENGKVLHRIVIKKLQLKAFN